MKTTPTKKNTVEETPEVVVVIQNENAELNLSDIAKKDLLKVLEKEIGPDKVKELSDEDLNKIGLLLLNILAEGLKMKVSCLN